MTDYLDELFCKAVANCERVTCIRCPMFSLTPLKNGNHCCISEIMKEAQRIQREAKNGTFEPMESLHKRIGKTRTTSR